MTLDPTQLHRDALVIDGHNDTIVSNIRRGHLDLCGQADARLSRLEGTIHYLRGPLPAEEREWHGQVDLSKLRAGGSGEGEVLGFLRPNGHRAMLSAWSVGCGSTTGNQMRI